MNYEQKYNEALERASKELMQDLHESGIWAIKRIFPELAESEDERIRKAIIDALRSHTNSINVLSSKGYSMDDVTAYLEKQKEQKPVQFKNNELVDIIKGEFEGFRTLLKKKGIDYEPQRSYWEGFARLFDSSAREYVREQKPAEKQDYSGLTDLERAIHRGFLAAGVENVPVGIIKETAKDCLVQTELIRYELPEDFEEAVFNVVNFMSPFSSEDELREISHRFAKQLLSLAKEEVQKPTWSENDENMLNEILENYKLRIYLGKSEIEWIESLKHRIQLQPKQEWNEEDEKKIERLRSIVNDCAFYDNALDVNGDYCEGDYAELDAWLKSLRPSWKPSEEQMAALAAAKIGVDTDYELLESLYEQLKAL